MHVSSRQRCCLFLLLCLHLAACSGGGRSLRRDQMAFFDVDVLAGVAEDGKPLATVTVSIPYRNLVFFATDEGFRAGYRIRAVQRLGESPIKMEEIRGEVLTRTYDETRERKAIRRTFRVDLAPMPHGAEAVALEVVVAIDGSQRVAGRTVAVDLRQLEAGGVALGELALYALRDRFDPPPYERLMMGRANPDPRFFRRQAVPDFDVATGEPWLLLRVFDLRPEVSNARFALEISAGTAGAGGARWTESLDVERVGHETSVLMRVPVAAFAFGTNTIRVRLENSEPLTIRMENLGLDLKDEESWRANLNQIEVLADKAEMDSLRSASAGEREERWESFWRTRDPDPDTRDNERLHEHYRRVAHARRSFRDGFRDGALSDRGKIWILHGPPDEVDHDTPTFDSYVSYEVWRYRDVGIAYYFRDTDGMGSYRLVWREAI